MVKLKKIIQHITPVKTAGKLPVEINAVCFDSRKVTSGDMFIAIRGNLSDGHVYIEKAIADGASVIVCEDIPATNISGAAYIQVSDTHAALGQIASNYYDHPSGKLKLIGVTGTNGKTTIATLLFQLHNKLGYKSGLISTVRNYIGDEPVDATHTTPDALQLNFLLAEMVNKGCGYCFMEVSSHAIVQHRITGLEFVGGIFTNLTHDHLDYHKTFGEYLKAKKLFFDGLPENAFALSNTDDKNGSVMLQNTAAKKNTYSLKSASDFKCKIMESHLDGMLLSVDGKEVWSKLIGTFNAYNLLAIYSAACLLGHQREEVLLYLSELQSVDGRFETIPSRDGIIAIVDYAHTPDALSNVLRTINEIRAGSGKLITVVGAGGNRDKTKRPLMAGISAELSDKVILTSDNPRNEKPENILDDMIKGVEPHLRKKVLTITDRHEAIKAAILLSGKGDIVLVAGKGHENYQEIDGTKYHFDDREVVRNLFNELN